MCGETKSHLNRRRKASTALSAALFRPFAAVAGRHGQKPEKVPSRRARRLDRLLPFLNRSELRAEPLLATLEELQELRGFASCLHHKELHIAVRRTSGKPPRTQPSSSNGASPHPPEARRKAEGPQLHSLRCGRGSITGPAGRLQHAPPRLLTFLCSDLLQRSRCRCCLASLWPAFLGAQLPSALASLGRYPEISWDRSLSCKAFLTPLRNSSVWLCEPLASQGVPAGRCACKLHDSFGNSFAGDDAKSNSTYWHEHTYTHISALYPMSHAQCLQSCVDCLAHAVPTV